MEDEFFVAPGSRLVGVFDGHGGSKVSEYLRDNLYGKFRARTEEKEGEGTLTEDEAAVALMEALVEVDKEVQVTR